MATKNIKIVIKKISVQRSLQENAEALPQRHCFPLGEGEAGAGKPRMDMSSWQYIRWTNNPNSSCQLEFVLSCQLESTQAVNLSYWLVLVPKGSSFPSVYPRPVASSALTCANSVSVTISEHLSRVMTVLPKMRPVMTSEPFLQEYLEQFA